MSCMYKGAACLKCADNATLILGEMPISAFHCWHGLEDRGA